MGIGAILLSMVLYCVIGYTNFKGRDYPHSMIWFSYALSQGGFLWYEIMKKGQIAP